MKSRKKSVLFLFEKKIVFSSLCLGRLFGGEREKRIPRRRERKEAIKERERVERERSPKRE